MRKELGSDTGRKHYACKSPRIQGRECHAKGDRSRSRSTKIPGHHDGSISRCKIAGTSATELACNTLSRRSSSSGEPQGVPMKQVQDLPTRSDVCSSNATTPVRRSAHVRNLAFPSSSNAADDNESSKDEPSSSSSSDAFSTPPKQAAKPKSNAEQIEKAKAVHFCWRPGMLMNSRYEVKDLLGDGTFGRVLLAEDLQKNRKVSIKVIRNVERYQRNAKHEAEMLRHIRKTDPKKTARCLLFYESFFHEAEDGARLICLVCEVLGMSLHDLMKQNQYRGFWVQDIQSISMQCLQALNFMHTELSLTHTDLKIENVLFVSTEPPEPAQFLREASWQEARQRIGLPLVSQQGSYLRPACTKVKLIDFGNATYERETHPKVINTRQYRAPEVFLDLGWNERSDLWAVGCTIMELYTGSLLFRTQESLEHLALVEQMVGKFPECMLQKTQQERFVLEEKEFSFSTCSSFRLRWPEGAASAASVNKVKQQRGLQKLIEKKHRALAEFAASLLCVDPSQRPSAGSALEQPFFSMRFSD
eukprot:TRINITY_DN45032_c0_g1_i1.p1 TRINITY_DN45032_c0_g1~~TRINITY_DN45032_c0_g1_i1.p1  ORF type:complete len:562 (-),score=70.20 TRINITY_DN45032_c0_g1_i1:85-1680(-)